MHGEASKRLLHPYWPGLLESEVPVESVTNGIHLGTWTAPEVMDVLGVRDRAVRGEDFREPVAASRRPALWSARRTLKERLLSAARTSAAVFTGLIRSSCCSNMRCQRLTLAIVSRKFSQ